MKISLTALILITAISLTPPAHAEKEPYDYVNTFIGSEPLIDPDIIGYTPPYGWRVWAGLTFPGASLPHGMVQLSPVTTFVTGSGYYYEDTVINGFTHTNKGHWNLCNISVMPVVTTIYIHGPGDRLGPFNSRGYGSSFSHEKEQASPGYYSVYLDDYDTRVECTVTERTGFHRYTFPESDKSHILIDLEKANSTISDAYVEIPDRQTVRGWQQFGGTKIYFHAVFDKRFDSCGVWSGWRTQKMADKPVSDSGADLGAWAKYNTQSGEQVQVKVGISFVSMDQARNNLMAENPGWDFKAVRSLAKETWRTLLNSVEVEGGTDKERTLFYSSLYRSCLWPVLRSDVDGRYIGADGKEDTADFNYYTLPSLWDTYRNKLPLLTLIEPEIKLDIIRSTVDMGTKRGWMPTFFHGDHATSMIVGSYLRGLKDFDVGEAYRLMRKNATESGGTRGDISEYMADGYIPTVPVMDANVPPTPGRAAVTKTLEYCYDDYSLALLAKELGKKDDYGLFMKRAEFYRNVFDKDTCFMRGREKNGRWVEPFNPKFPYYGYMYREANAWQSTFFVPHDVQGLIEIMGGRNRFISKLDSLFSVPWDPSHIARNTCCMIGQYSHGNQPDHQAPYMYNYAGVPWKTQRITRKIMNTMYGIGEKGLALPGMDDAGEMSAWYVFSAMGFYPVAPSIPYYAIGSPLFDKVTIHLPDYLYGGRDFTIEAANNSSANMYIQSLEKNGRKTDTPWFSEDDIKAGSTLKFQMGPEPNKTWGADESDALPVIR